MTISKLTVAAEYLGRAIELYFRGDSYFSALHLAGAAQELLGKFVERTGADSAHTSLVKGAVRISKFLNEGGEPSTDKDIRDIVNHAKNRSKHMNAVGDDVVEFDARTQARAMLDLAISEFYYLYGNGAELELSDEIERYNLYQVERAPIE
ncbi:hypothetical protein [Massilia sp. LjRoot122]|uniref:hypothetical protein n=1 Tax=Massilia sp. LjRoot122 TaxID=3342257 RepID=UPI003ED0BDE1